MSRPVDEERRAELRAAILQYLIEHGITDLSLRPLAKAVRSSPRALLYHFESKENLVISVLADMRQQQRSLFAQIRQTSKPRNEHVRQSPCGYVLQGEHDPGECACDAQASENFTASFDAEPSKHLLVGFRTNATRATRRSKLPRTRQALQSLHRDRSANPED